VPNRRRRRLSTAMSAVAALAVASPAAIVAVSDLSENAEPPTQHRQFVQAAMVTDLPNELMSALSQGLSQFGINLPPMPTSLLTGTGASTPTTLTSPGSYLTPPSSLGAAPVPTPALGTLPDATLLTPANTNPALSPGLTSPVGVSPVGTLPSTPGGLTTTPPAGLATTPADASLGALSPAAALPAPGEIPISTPVGLGYPIDPSLGAAPAATSTGSGGLLGDIGNAANTLGAGQAIDLLKGILMPAIMSAVKPAGAPAADAAAAVPAAVAALPAAAAIPTPGI
jgi:hypothetical protein